MLWVFKCVWHPSSNKAVLRVKHEKKHLPPSLSLSVYTCGICAIIYINAKMCINYLISERLINTFLLPLMLKYNFKSVIHVIKTSSIILHFLSISSDDVLEAIFCTAFKIQEKLHLSSSFAHWFPYLCSVKTTTISRLKKYF